MRRHKHQWQELGRQFTEPGRGEATATYKGEGTAEFFLMVAFGFTTVELECECGDRCFRRTPGRVGV